MQAAETERLILRQFTTDDADFIIELLNSPGWLEFIGDRKIRTREDALNYIVNVVQKMYAQTGFGLWLVQLKKDKTPVGMCGLLKRDTLPDADIGFAFLPQYAGAGYAYEAAAATLEEAKRTWKLPRVAAITVKENRRSIRLLEKIGLRFERMIVLPGDPEELMLFGMDFSA